MYEELEPIEKNIQYDFNFQQSNHLRREVTILPVSPAEFMDELDFLLASLDTILCRDGEDVCNHAIHFQSFQTHVLKAFLYVQV